MKLHNVSLVLLLSAQLLAPQYLFAAGKKISPAEVFSVPDGQGGSMYCATRRGKTFFVIKKKGKYISGNSIVQKLKRSVDASSGSARTGLEKKLKKAKKRAKKNNLICQSGGGGSASLEPLDRALTREDVQYFLDKAGLGLSSKEANLVTIGVNQGIGALVTEFMKIKSEPAGLLDRVEDELDGQIGLDTTQSPAGQRIGLLDIWIHTNNPYSERLALTLLSIWTVSGDVIQDETFRHSFWNYYTRLRDAAKADVNLPGLGVEITRDPLMLIYLNNELNVKDAPNENYARELMELFTLGPTDLDGNPNYTETATDGSGDIATAARMLTGWKVHLNYGINELESQYDSTRHANGPHTMFAGKAYAFSGEDDEDLVRGIFAHHPGVKHYYAKELLKEYLTPNPPRELIENFGNVIAANNYRLRPALKALFQSKAFFDPTYRDTVPMNSLEFAAKSARQLELAGAVNVNNAEYQLRKMGMQFNFAPSVFWYNPDNWLSASISVEKANYVAQILDDSNAQEQLNPDWTPAKILPVGSATPAQVIEHARKRLGLQPFNASQQASVIEFMSKIREYDGTYTSITYDNSDSDHQRLKGLGVYYLMFLTAGYQTK